MRLGLGVPAIYNDEVIIPALQNRGVSLADARDYGIVGCVEPQAIHRTEGWHDAAFFNVAKVLEITLHNGKAGDLQLGPVTGEMTSWKSIDDFYEAFTKQMSFFVKHLAEADNCVDIAHAERAPLPFLSAMVDDCMGRGKSVQEGGAIYNFTGPQAFGVADSGDSVYAMKKFVFDDKSLTMADLKEALDANFGLGPGREGKRERQHRADGRAGLRGCPPGSGQQQLDRHVDAQGRSLPHARCRQRQRQWQRQRQVRQHPPDARQRAVLRQRPSTRST